ncbi:unnamed protein product [Cunninghamella blakesleeana]
MFQHIVKPTILKTMTPQSKLSTFTRSFSSLISVSELSSSLNSVKVLDSSWHLDGRDAYKDFLNKRIPGSQFFGIDIIKDTNTNLPHMLPSPKVFAEAVGELGINNEDHVVVYDTIGTFSAARVYWTFKAFGHQQVSILNGGLPAWLQENQATVGGPIEKPKRQHYQEPILQKELVKSYDQVLTIVDQYQKKMNQNEPIQDLPQIIDARSYARFNGETAEPRPGIKGGHMPGSICVPFRELDNDLGFYKDDAALKQLFESKGVDLNKPIITTCGSGITASMLYIALERAGAKKIAVYDGSWTEYGGKEDSIVVKNV